MGDQHLSAVGSEKTTDHNVAHLEEKEEKSSEKTTSVNVDWSVKGEWNDTLDDVKNKTGITKYKLSQSDADKEYKYHLEYKTDYTKEYRFIDENLASHRSDAKSDEDNKVSYNSSKPTIKTIKLPKEE